MPLHVDGLQQAAIATRSNLPAAQQQLVTALAATGKPLVIVLMNGSALALTGRSKMPRPSSKPGIPAGKEARRWQKLLAGE